MIKQQQKTQNQMKRKLKTREDDISEPDETTADDSELVIQSRKL